MIDGRSVSVVLPCFNEESGVHAVLTEMPEEIDEVVVVDNNSVDRTADVAIGFGALVVPESVQGYGAAFKTGFSAATGDVLVGMDGDGSYSPAEVPRLVRRLLSESLDFVSASRFPLSDPGSMQIINIIGNRILTIAMRLVFGIALNDSQSGMWVFRREVFEQISIRSDGMAFSEEIKLEAILQNHAFAEDHITYSGRIGAVKLRRWRDGVSNLVFLFRRRGESRGSASTAERV